MTTCIDKIYGMLSWNSNERVQSRGIKKAKKIKSLNVFILPLLPEGSKSVWENCAKVLYDKSDEELQIYLIHLFEWLQDMNWPGADLIFKRLVNVREDMLLPAYKHCVLLAEKTDDFPWKLSLESFYKEYTGRN